MKSIGQKLKELRNSLNLSQSMLSEELGISIQSIYRYESDKNSPDSNVLKQYSKYFEVSTDYLLGLLPYEKELKEVANKVLLGGEFNCIYKHYINCKKNYLIDDESEYYWIYSKAGELYGGQTQWVGWVDDTCTLEIRRLRPVIPIKAIKMCTELCGSPMLLNEEADVLAFRLFGGQAIVKRKICESYLPEFLEDHIVKCQNNRL